MHEINQASWAGPPDLHPRVRSCSPYEEAGECDSQLSPQKRDSPGQVRIGRPAHAHLQVCPDKGLLSSVVEVVPHQEVEQLGSLGPDGAQLGVAALENLIAERGAHVRPSFIERRGELERAGGHSRAQQGQCSAACPNPRRRRSALRPQRGSSLPYRSATVRQ